MCSRSWTLCRSSSEMLCVRLPVGLPTAHGMLYKGVSIMVASATGMLDCGCWCPDGLQMQTC